MGKTNYELVRDFNKVFQREKLNPLADFTDLKEVAKATQQLQLIEEELEELREAIINNDWDGCKDAVADLLVVTYGMGYIMDINADKAVQEVNRANMTKVCITKDQVKRTVDKYNKEGVECSVLKSSTDDGDVWLVKSSKDQEDSKGKFYPKGKFLKNVDWEEPNLWLI